LPRRDAESLAVKPALLVAGVLILLLVVYLVVSRRSAPAPQATTPVDDDLAGALRRDVSALCANGPRNVYVPESLAAAAAMIEQSLAAGSEVERQTYRVDDVEVANLIVEIAGAAKRDEIVVIGAHYDSVDDSPGADDNASGVAALLALARRFAGARPERTLRFVAFVNEEPPHFQTQSMGSWRYARRCRERGEKVVAMLSLEAIGYYDDRPGSQQYPPMLHLLYPDRGDFIAFASNLASRTLLNDGVRAFRARTGMPLQSAALPRAVEPIGWSDQWSFWEFDYPAIMVTDTAPFRNPHYHTRNDVPDTLDYDRMARVVEGLGGVVRELAGVSR
jgi:hypothetical protein